MHYSVSDCIWSRCDLDINYAMIRHLKHSFFELIFCLRLTRSFTLAKSFSLFSMLSHKPHFWFVAFCVHVLKSLSFWISGLSFPAFVRGFFLTHCINATDSSPHHILTLRSLSPVHKLQCWKEVYNSEHTYYSRISFK